MRKLKLHTDGLKCDVEARTLTGMLLPYGEPGATSLGRVTASKATKLALAEKVIGNLQHDRKRPVATLTASEQTAKGLRATFTVLETRAGDDLLAEAAAGVRTGMSIEMDNPVISAGKLLAGTVDQVGFVTEPAFPSARLTAEAADTADDEDDEDEDQVEDQVDDEDQDDTDDDQETETVKPNQLAAARTKLRAAKPPKTKEEAYGRLKAAFVEGGSQRMLAALADITSASVTADVTQEAWLGELWDSAPYDRRFVPLMTHGDLTSWEYRGWRWVNKPTVADYSGNKTEIPSNTVSTEDMSGVAARIAGGHDLDRKFIDFGDTEFLDSYMSAMTESYKMVSDFHAENVLLANATQVAPGVIPTNGNASVGAIIDAYLAVLSATRTAPDDVVVGDAVMRALAFQGIALPDILGQRFNLSDGQLAGINWVAGGPDFPAGQVLASVRKATRFLELPGSPIRVSALDIAHGGEDRALFGYWGYLIDNPLGLALVTATPASINAGADYSQATGTDHQLVVLATGADGAVYDVTGEATFSSATPAKATVGAHGLVHGVAAGTSVLTAQYGTRTDTVTVTVT